MSEDENAKAARQAAQAWADAASKRLDKGLPAFGMEDGKLVRINADGSTSEVGSAEIEQAMHKLEEATKPKPGLRSASHLKAAS